MPSVPTRLEGMETVNNDEPHIPAALVPTRLEGMETATKPHIWRADDEFRPDLRGWKLLLERFRRTKRERSDPT